LWTYLTTHLFKLEESFTLLFLGLFLCFLYLYVTGSSDDIDVVFSPESIKVAMWVSAFLAIVSHLTPKGPKKEEEVAATRSKEYYKVNDQVKRSIMNAIRIDEQKRLENLKKQPSIQSRGLSS
jgi:hypothetical protein